MPNTKISALTSATTPLAGTETLPIVQSGATKQVSVANLTAGRAITASNLDVAIIGATTPANGTFTLVNGVSGNPQVGYFANTNAASGTISTQVQLASYNGSSVSVGTYLLETSNGWSSTNFAGGVANTTVLEGTKAGGVAIVSANASAPVRFCVGGESSASEKWRMNSTGNLVPFVAAKGVDFSANTPAAGKTSTLLNWYETGTWTPTFTSSAGSFTSITYDAAVTGAKYTRIGNVVYIQGSIRTSAITVGTASGNLLISGIPFSAVANSTGQDGTASGSISQSSAWAINTPSSIQIASSTITLFHRLTANGASALTQVTDAGTGAAANLIRFSGSYLAA